MNLNRIPNQHKFYILFIIAILFFKAESYSRSLNIVGDISSDVTWSGNVYVSGDITVKHGATLTISKGCKVEIQGSFSITIEGRLLALGTDNDSIHFTPSDKMEGWQGIKFNNIPLSNDTSKIDYCIIRYSKIGNSNTIASGAGISVTNSSKLIIANSQISYNQSLIGSGAGIACFEKSNIIIKNNVLSNNIASVGGGGIFISDSEPLINNNLILNNKASYGGGINLNGSKATVSYNIIRQNYSSLNGGGILCQSSDAKLLNNVIVKNNASENGGGIALFSSNTEIVNNTITYNTVENTELTGTAIYFGPNDFSRPKITNSIIYGNTAQNGYQVYMPSRSTQPNISYCNIEGGMDAIYGYFGKGSSNLGAYNNIIDKEPGFEDVPNNNYTLSWNNYPQENAVKSPSIDAGNPLSKHDPDGSIVDLGAYYFNQTHKKFPPRADFYSDTTLGYNRLKVSFENLSDKGTGKIIKWEWSFGDNTYTNEEHASHNYTTGIHSVSLKVTDEYGLSDTKLVENLIVVNRGIYIPAGNVSGSWLGGEDEYLIAGNISIPSGQSLRIEPNTKVVFMGPYYLDVKGQLFAEGTKEFPISFDVKDSTEFYSTSHDSFNGGWGGIKFTMDYENQDSSKISYCKIEHVKSSYSAIHTGLLYKLIISNCLINNNFSYGLGGGISSYAECLIINNVIKNNVATHYGGGIFISGSTKVVNNFIMNNVAKVFGGGIACNNKRPFISNNVILNNKADRAGGVWSIHCSPKIINNTIIDNSDGGVYLMHSDYTHIVSNIILGNSNYQVNIDHLSTNSTIEYNLIQGGKDGVQSSLNFDYSSTNIDQDPLVITAKNIYGRISKNSPCINAGLPDTQGVYKMEKFDIIGNERLKDDRIDIGAYEYAAGDPPLLLSSLGNVKLPQDFGKLIFNLDTIFNYYLGNEWMSFDIAPESDTAVISASIEGSQLTIQSRTNSYGNAKIVINAMGSLDGITTDTLYVVVEKAAITGTDKNFSDLLIFPNPTLGFINIKDNLERDLEIKIIGLKGELILVKKFLKAEKYKEIDLRELPSGSYHLEIRFGKDRINRTVLKE